jgi:serine/threonine protein kinase
VGLGRLPEALIRELSVHHRYEVVATIGHFGERLEFVARHLDLRTQVVVRVHPFDQLHPNVEPDSDAANTAVVDRCLEKLRRLSGLRHPATIKIHDVFLLEQSLCVVTEYLEGAVPLDEYLHHRGGGEAGGIVRIFQRIVSGLAHAHALGIVHGELRPRFILVKPDGSAKLAGFDYLNLGLLGTLRYVAPEQLEHGVVNARTDIFLLGIVLYEAFTGRLPFPQSPRDFIQAFASKRDKLAFPKNATVPKSIRVICEKCLSFAPRDRYGDAGELLDDLRLLGQNSGWRRVLPELLRRFLRTGKPGPLH